MRKFLFFFVFLWSESATTLRHDWTNTCVLESCKNDASECEERKSPHPGKRSAKRSVRVYAANCDCVTCLSKTRISWSKLLVYPLCRSVAITCLLCLRAPWSLIHQIVLTTCRERALCRRVVHVLAKPP